MGGIPSSNDSPGSLPGGRKKFITSPFSVCCRSSVSSCNLTMANFSSCAFSLCWTNSRSFSLGGVKPWKCNTRSTWGSTDESETTSYCGRMKCGKDPAAGAPEPVHSSHTEFLQLVFNLLFAKTESTSLPIAFRCRWKETLALSRWFSSPASQAMILKRCTHETSLTRIVHCKGQSNASGDRNNLTKRSSAIGTLSSSESGSGCSTKLVRAKDAGTPLRASGRPNDFVGFTGDARVVGREGVVIMEETVDIPEAPRSIAPGCRSVSRSAAPDFGVPASGGFNAF
mmetsp:Transcript_118511/g.377741  ORF Transcript_118511/g.377741 Transcript_118511/m.377741 type:complete len:284 (-) Transcript_118511:1305-2156(-)